MKLCPELQGQLQSQAIGAVIAIFASALLLHYQFSLQRRNRIKGLESIFILTIKAVTRRLSVPDDEIAVGFFRTLDIEEIEFAYETLCKIPLHELESAEIVQQVSVVTRMTRRVLLTLKSYESAGALNPHQRTVPDTTFQEEVDAMREARKRLNSITRRRWWKFWR